MSIAPGIYDDLSDIEYHADPALSSSGARTIVGRSPAHYVWERTHPVRNFAFDIGSAVHSRVLGVGDDIEVIEAAGRYSKAAKAAIEEAHEAGTIPVLRSEYEAVQGMAESVLSHPRARSLLECDGRTELSVFADDPATGVRLKARADRYIGRFVDLKTSQSCLPKDFQGTIEKFRYDVQWAFYDRVFRAAGENPEISMSMIVVEKKRPHYVAVHDLDDQYFKTGSITTDKAIRVFAECLNSGRWFGPADSLIEPTGWFESRLFEEELI